MEEHYSATTCGGTSWLTHKQVFDKFPGDIEYGALKPPFSKEKLFYHLDQGRTIMVGGQFTPFIGSGSKSHFSYIVGYTGDKLIFADPFFHENHFDQVNEYLEDFYKVVLEEAYVITDPSSDHLEFGE